MNTDARGGALRVEMLNAKNEVIAVSRNVDQDSARMQLQWEEGEIADLYGQTVSLRFTLRNAQIYSWWIE